MKCPVCDSKRTKVYNSRKTQPVGDDLEIVVRYRSCADCDSRWKTQERFDVLVMIEGKSTRADRVKSGELHNIRATRKLTPKQVTEIRERKAAGSHRDTLAKGYGVTPQHISRIVRGARW